MRLGVPPTTKAPTYRISQCRSPPPLPPSWSKMVENGSKWKRCPKISKPFAFVACAILSFWNVLVWAVENASKRLCGRESLHDRCVFDDNENAYFWKHISVDRASDKCFQTCVFFLKKRMFVFNEPIQYYHSSKMNEFQSRVAPSCLVLFKKLFLFLKISNSNWIDPDDESDRVNKNNEVLLYKVQRPQPPGLRCTY